MQNRETLVEIAQNGALGFKPNTDTILRDSALVVSHVNARSGFERDGSFSTSKGDRWQMFDAGIATQTFCLTAWAHGVDSVILGLFDEAVVSKLIDLPENETVAALIAIGYLEKVGPAPKRKPVEKLLRII